jgi:hypothetical protein
MSSARESSLPNVTCDPEGDDDRSGNVREEERLDSVSGSKRWVFGILDGEETNVELSDENDTDQDETDVRTNDTTDSSVREFLDRVTLNLPCSSESDVSEENSGPSE